MAGYPKGNTVRYKVIFENFGFLLHPCTVYFRGVFALFSIMGCPQLEKMFCVSCRFMFVKFKDFILYNFIKIWKIEMHFIMTFKEVESCPCPSKLLTYND